METMLRNYTYLNTGLTIMHNGRRILSRHGLQDLLSDNMTNEGLYDIVHMKGEDIEKIKSAQSELMTSAQKIGEALYAQQGAAGAADAAGAAAGASGAASNGGDDDVVDAEVVDDDDKKDNK